MAGSNLGNSIALLRGIVIAFFWIAFFIFPHNLIAFEPPDEEVVLGKELADIPVVDFEGNQRTIRDFLDGRPLVLSPIFTRCPHSCSLITANLKRVVEKMGSHGKDFTVLTFSFDPRDDAEALQNFCRRWEVCSNDWQVVSSDSANIKYFLASFDFQTDLDEKSGVYYHPNLAVIITPKGKISRFVHGILPKANDLRIALIEAKKEKFSLSVYEGLLLNCFQYDPVTKTFVIDWSFVIQVVVGGIIVGSMVGYLLKESFVRLAKFVTG